MASFQDFSISNLGNKFRNITNSLVNGDDSDLGEESDYLYDDDLFGEEEEVEESDYAEHESMNNMVESASDEDIRNIFAYEKQSTIHTVEVALFNAEAQQVLIYFVTEEIKRGAVVIIDFNNANESLLAIWQAVICTLEFGFDAHADFSSLDRCILCPSHAISTNFVAGEDKNLYIYVPYLEKAYDLDNLNKRIDEAKEKKISPEDLGNIKRGNFKIV